MAELAERISELDRRLGELETFFDLEGLRERAAELSEEMSDPGFWDDPEEAREVSSRFSRIEERIALLESLRGRLDDSEELFGLYDGDPEMLGEVEREVGQIEATVEQQEAARMFNGPYDEGPAILTINSGAGGVDSQDWAGMLARMYRRWAETRGLKLSVIEHTDGEEAGLKSATYTVGSDGDYGFGLLAAERGVHRLVRISPFDAGGRRHTSFASVAVAPVIDDAVEVEVDEKDLKVDTYRASGAGGQHVNKTDSAVRITHQPSGIVVQCQNERSQHQNREVAMRILRARLYELEQEKLDREMAAQAGEKSDIGWGSQIRSYTLHPDRRIKDLRTGEQASGADVDKVLDGDLDSFIYAYLKTRDGG
ncbi:peptide chain release factor 2 [Rubrobacter aplysinae]|uniref:peptide chain release factor 2 n=1 Tax=Rubrobacter aplysinae TaxID=909625 RepID=UPI00069EC526|nr:peptide chain release factor 2 [Rubrobacter aplysinae]